VWLIEIEGIGGCRLPTAGSCVGRRKQGREVECGGSAAS